MMCLVLLIVMTASTVAVNTSMGALNLQIPSQLDAI